MEAAAGVETAAGKVSELAGWVAETEKAATWSELLEQWE